MQIHELNGYTGALDDAYMAVDNGSDTGKEKIKDITDPLNARIDNIIAGPAPSAQEVTDARLGADGVVYPSLGDAIRDQFGGIAELERGKNRFNFDEITTGYYLNSDGTLISNNNWATSGFCYVKGLSNVVGSYTSDIQTGVRSGQGLWFACTFDANRNFVRYLGNSPGITVALNASDVYLRFCFNSGFTADNKIQLESGTLYTVYEPYTTHFVIKNVANSKQTRENTSDLNGVLNGFEGIIKSTNRFNGSFTPDCYLDEHGYLLTTTSFITTDYINIEGYDYVVASATENSKRVLVSMFYCCEYDENKQFLRQLGTSLGSSIALTGDASYIRFSPHNQYLNSELQVECGKAQTVYDPFKNVDVIKPDNLPHKLELLISQSSIKQSKNRFQGGWVSGYLNAGAIDSSNSFKTCGYIDVHDFEYATASCVTNGVRNTLNMFYCCAYDENKNYIKQYGSMPGATLAIDDDTYYIRFSRGDVDSLTDIQVESGQTYSSYEPYYEELDLGASLNTIWANKKWVCVGDSLTESNQRTDKHYFDYVADDTGIQVVNMGVSGTGYARGRENNNAFYQRILNAPTDLDVITIFGSGNDGGAGLQLGSPSDTGTSTLAGCINTTIDNLYSILPVVELGIVTPTPWQGNMPYNEGFMENYSNLLVAICGRRSIPCLDLFHCSNLDPNSADVRAAAYSKDDGNGTHPDELGHKIIAPRFKAFLDSLII